MSKRGSKSSQDDDESLSDLDLLPAASKRSRPCEDVSDTTDEYNLEETAGTVKHIRLKNFMCHASMDIVLNPKVNFVVGRNGSGKSAILTALIVGLGGKAATTSRGSALKDFIKDGTNITSIEITLNNKGSSAFKKHIYGDEITVTRLINKGTGASSYKLKTANGEVRRIKREELDKIIHAFNIQIDNPICILNQDTARKFLNSSDPEEKYLEFMKATSMFYISHNYENAMFNKHSALVALYRKRKHLEIMEHEVQQWEHKWKLSQSIDTYRKRKRQLENELYWAVACELERKIEKLQKQYDEQRSLCPKLLVAVEKEKEEEIALKTQIRDVDEKLSTMQAEYSEAEEIFKQSREDARLKKERLAVSSKSLQVIKNEITRMQDEVCTLESEIKRIRAMSESEYAEKKAELKKKIHEMEKAGEELQATLKMRVSHGSKLKADVQQAAEDVRMMNREIQELQIRIGHKRQQIEALRTESSNSMAVFGSKIPQLLQKINVAHQQGKFCRKPIGPLGAFIKLKDASWAAAVESVIRGLLHSFCVHNQQDLHQLNKIFQEVFGDDRKPHVVTSKFLYKVHDVTKYAVQSQKYSNLLDMLIVNNAVVVNCIIDQLEVETILLIPTSEEAYEIMSNAANVPRNCKRAITKQGHIFFPDPNYKSYAGDGNLKPKFLQVSTQEAIRVAEVTLKELEEQKKALDKNLKTVKMREIAVNREADQVATEIEELKNNGRLIKSKLMKLRESDEPETGSVATLSEEFDQYKRLMAAKVADCAEMQEKENIYSVEQKKSEAESQRLRNVLVSQQRKEQPILMQKKELTNKLLSTMSRKEYQQKKYDKQCSKLNQFEENLKETEQQMLKAVEDANVLCSRIDTDRSPETVQKELNDCKTYIASIEEESGTQEEVAKSYFDKKTKYASIENEVKELENALEILNKLLQERRRSYQTALRLTTTRVQQAFQFLLYRRNFKGQLNVDHKQKKLLIEASSSSGDVQISNPMNLSGGERSYFTVALIMALWDCVEPPFYVMDEFDVFMDKVNRRVVMDLLVAHAQETKEHQFIFLTPQDTSSVTSTTDISILRLEDPRKSAKK